jgi:hypothetical protein
LTLAAFRFSALLTRQEAARIITACRDPRDWTMLVLYFGGGLHLSELGYPCDAAPFRAFRAVGRISLPAIAQERHPATAFRSLRYSIMSLITLANQLWA